MIKSIILSLFLFSTLYCTQVLAQDSVRLVEPIQFDSTGINQVINDTNIQMDILYGYCNRAGLRSSDIFKDSFNAEYSSYLMNLQFIRPIIDSLYATNITIVMGSWCEDSQREVPRMIKILDHLDFPESQLTIIGVNRMKQAPIKDFDSMIVAFVPTIIFYKNNIEIGRIVEMPMQSLEDDMTTIIMQIKE